MTKSILVFFSGHSVLCIICVYACVCYLSHSYSIEHRTDYKIGLRLSVNLYQSASTLTVAILDRFLPKLAKT